MLRTTAAADAARHAPCTRITIRFHVVCDHTLAATICPGAASAGTVSVSVTCSSVLIVGAENRAVSASASLSALELPAKPCRAYSGQGSVGPDAQPRRSNV